MVVSPARIQALRRPERLEGRGLDRVTLERSLDHVAQATRVGGGFRATVRLLAGVGNSGDDLRLLDIGCGSGVLAGELARRAAIRGRRWRAVGIELHPEIVRVAARRWRAGSGCAPVRADARALPFPDGSFDAVVATLTLHHFGEEGVVAVLREMSRVSRELVLVNDLERHPLARLGAWFLARTLWRRNPLTRHDGPLSVQRGFRREELLEAANSARLLDPVVRRRGLFRLLLYARPGTAPPDAARRQRRRQDPERTGRRTEGSPGESRTEVGTSGFPARTEAGSS